MARQSVETEAAWKGFNGSRRPRFYTRSGRYSNSRLAVFHGAAGSATLFSSPSHNPVNRVMEWIENRVARAARWLTSWNPAEIVVWLFVVCVTCALLGPWLQRSRDESRRVETMNRLRHMGTAMHSYAELHRSLPSGGRPRPVVPNPDSNDTDSSPTPVRPIQDTP
ncbi:MAG: DUF1559 domain-containing protein [Planctomycetota bacterium]|nr:DUF1559 domain-containing protein [Planctomycetota bacterium]